MTYAFPKSQVLIGFNNAALDDNTAWTIGAGDGTLGAAGVWTDISIFSRQRGGNRGRQHELNRFESGPLTIDLWNADSRFNPWNTTGPYYGLLTPGKQIQIRAIWQGTTFYRYTGHLAMLPLQWPDEVNQYAQFTAYDGFRLLNSIQLVQNNYASTIIADGATQYWRCNDAPGSITIKNSIAGGTDGLLVVGGASNLPQYGTASPLLTTSNAGSVSAGALNNAGSQNYVDVQGAGINGSVSFSAECWFKDQTISNSSGCYLIGQNDPISGFAGSWGIYAAARFGIDFVTTDNAAVRVDVNQGGAGNTLQDGKWHHVVVTYNTSTGAMQIFQDGALAASGSCATGITFSASPAHRVVLLASSTTTYADGSSVMAEVAFYQGTILTAAQVATHYRLGVGYIQESTGSRLNSVLNNINWPAAMRNIDTGLQTCQVNQQNLVTTGALAHLQQAEVTEGGALFMDPAGKVRFVSRPALAQSSPFAIPQAYFGDATNNAGATYGGKWGDTNAWGVEAWGMLKTAKWGDTNAWGVEAWGSPDLPFRPNPQLALDDLDVLTSATVTRVGGIAETYSVTPGVSGPKSQSVSNVLHLTDAASLQNATWRVNKLSRAIPRLRTVTIDLVDVLSANYSQADINNNVATILRLDLMNRVVIERTRVGFTETALIERIEEKVTPNSWQITLSLSPTDTYPAYSWSDAQ